ncbi:ABC transporter ATP-binding protein [Zhihengliuella halotolerans]|uniref:Putative spermidine/putrescine transport system ATP-binding protein n=1 Tax=Zhihengliuella halotolerans TaxID=370736 RepID=A0A4Q8AEZ6_9MICC|nr:ABC transporter ATP-binding protein [Zhihengliuella halotolerans]RZU62411.1 putative spermidine/putrescine transport system ATP-binding protein [Zhihengliuella halotolerans]
MTAVETIRATAADGVNEAGAAIRLTNVVKTFGDFTAVQGLDLTIRQGEFFSLLGPSGSGKTTVLRLIAGFELPTTGTIHLGERDVTDAPPFDRAVNTVFQDYALFPHMSVARNIEYGLTLRRVSRPERRRRVAEALEMIRLPHVADRLPSQLSGGQRQRVALARALVLEPEVLLLDEPLGALDKQLREQMQIELKQIQRDVGITFVFVTHDQEEALTLSDRVAVFNEGRVEQIGTPEDLYERPSTRFTATFLGTTNLIGGELARAIGVGADLVSVRPERVRLRPVDSVPADGTTHVEAVLEEFVYTGPATRFVATTSGGDRIVSLEPNDASRPAPVRGERVRLEWDRSHNYPVSGQ